MLVPADGHVHSEWSYDAPGGSMERTCERAIELGLPAVAFTEHADYTVTDALAPPAFSFSGYHESLLRCRERFPSLRIISGVELGEPHWHSSQVGELLASGSFERILGSLHCLPIGERFAEPPHLYRQRDAADVLRDYLAEIPRLVSGSAVFSVLAHIDYAVRYWPASAGPFDPLAFEDEFRHALRALAESGRALEVNTRAKFPPEVVAWWRDVGGGIITFGSDAHTPSGLAQGFATAVAMVEAHGFRPGSHPYDYWYR